MLSADPTDLKDGLVGAAAPAPPPVAAPATQTSAEEANATQAAPTTCPQGHTLVYARAIAGRCDRCGGHVGEKRWVRDCRECNWYLCGVCTPITECPEGSPLRTVETQEGKRCSGCKEWIPEGKLVMESQQGGFTLCRRCQPLTQCLEGHQLKLWTTRAPGRCSRCRTPTKTGDVVMDCHVCQWSLCAACQPQLSAAAEFWSTSGALPQPLPQCPQGHDCLPGPVGRGKYCDLCKKNLTKGAMVSECEQCNYHICSECHAIRQCREGHMLEARPAPPGTCDGCGRRVEMYQSVMDCRQCNWYLCGSCHIQSARNASTVANAISGAIAAA